MVVVELSNSLKITGLPESVVEHYKLKCNYNTSAYQAEGIPSAISLFYRDEHDNSVYIPRGLYFELVKLCKELKLPMTHINKTFCGEDYNFTINSKINYKSGIYGYQEKTIKNLIKYKTARLQAIAGSGKTVMMCLIAGLLNKGPVIYLANKERLIKQFILSAEKILGVKEEDIGLIKADKFSIKPLTCGSLQTLGKSDFDIESLRYKFYTVFYDECHLSTALTYRKVLLNLAPQRLYGFSATPEHYSSEDLNHLMTALLGPIVVTISDAEVPKRLKPKTYSRETGKSFYFNATKEDPEWKKFKARNRLFSSISEDVSRNKLIITDIKKLLKVGHKILVCVNRVSHGYLLKNLLEDSKIKVSFPYKLSFTKTGEEKAKVDHKKLNADVIEVDRNNIQIIIGTYRLFDTGFDCPALSAILYAAPFSGDNTTQIVQSVGRIQRYLPDKINPIVIDYIDDSNPINILRNWADKRSSFFQQIFNKHNKINS